MGDKSKIEWTDATWNPVSGCRKVSPGCDNCYAIPAAHRMGQHGNPKISKAYRWLTVKVNGRLNWTGKIKLLERRLDQPARWARPRCIFVNSMSDLFHEDIPDEYIQKVFLVMMKAKQHIFQVLTKRPERMVEVLKRIGWNAHFLLNPEQCQHIWLGVSVEDHKRLTERGPWLSQIQSRVRWLSCEPLLGPILALETFAEDLDWVVVGGESGPRARAIESRWIYPIAEMCRVHGIPFFMKQWSQRNRPYDYKDVNTFPSALQRREYPNVQHVALPQP